jgi:excisionase family DNA binding protein
VAAEAKEVTVPEDSFQQSRSNLLTIEESSALIRLKPSTLRDWLLKRKIPYVKLGRRVFIRRSDIEALISASVVSAANGANQRES